MQTFDQALYDHVVGRPRHGRGRAARRVEPARLQAAARRAGPPRHDDGRRPRRGGRRARAARRRHAPADARQLSARPRPEGARCPRERAIDVAVLGIAPTAAQSERGRPRAGRGRAAALASFGKVTGCSQMTRVPCVTPPSWSAGSGRCCWSATSPPGAAASASSSARSPGSARARCRCGCARSRRTASSSATPTPRCRRGSSTR